MERALKVIPNGNMFLSKNQNQFLPDIWPAILLKVKIVLYGTLIIKIF